MVRTEASKRAKTDNPRSVLNDFEDDDENDMLASDDGSEEVEGQLRCVASGRSNGRKKQKRPRSREAPNGNKGFSLTDLPPQTLTLVGQSDSELLLGQLLNLTSLESRPAPPRQLFAELSLDGLHALSLCSRKFNELLQPHANLELWRNARDDLDELPDQSDCGLMFFQIAELLYGRTCAVS